ncbi:MAG: HipA domain-containing protein [Erysipelotrichaceae bacterium]|nr:HipA domain-containing protein [Erysipelotrichaceae bacterium]
MIDFTNMPVRNKTYAGANGSKISILYNGSVYMLKFPPVPSINKEMSYANSCISEYIGCHIFESVGIPVQETILGTYTRNGKQKIVVACKDFTASGLLLQDFASLKNTIVDSVRNGYGTNLEEIEQTFQEQTAIDEIELRERFWDMFIVDTLIGNWDRHNGNWGFLYDAVTDRIQLAPVFDCGSALFPQADENTMELVLSNQAQRDIRVFEIPKSALILKGKKIKYFDFISSLENDECNQALLRIYPRINMEKIYQIVDDTPFISELQKSFYKTMLKERKERILDFAFNKLINKDHN